MNSGGAMPTTVRGKPLSVMVWPIRFGSAPKRLCQKASLTTTTGCALSVLSSSGENVRPWPALTPSTSK